MKSFLTTAALCVAFASTAHAGEIGFGPLEVGVTSCSEAEDLARSSRTLRNTDISAVTDGSMLRMGPGAFGLSFVSSATVICDGSDQTVEAVNVVISKTDAASIADALEGKYERVSRNLPRLGAGEALYRSESGDTEAWLRYQHVSFDANILVSTKAFDKALADYQNSKVSDAQSEKEGAF